MAVIEATPETFDQLVQAEYAMVDFYGDHCGACVFTAPFYRQAADEMAFVKFIKVNTSAYPELGKRFGVVGLPTFLYFRDGKEAFRSTGGMDLKRIREQLSHLLYPSQKGDEKHGIQTRIQSLEKSLRLFVQDQQHSITTFEGFSS